MLKIKHPTKEQSIKSSVAEFTIGEFENMVHMMNDPEKDTLDRWSNIFVYCGLDQEILDDMDTFDFINLIKEFNIFNLDSDELYKSIILDDIEYIAYDEEFKITVREMRLIEGFIKKDSNKYIANVMAVLYKRPDIDKSMTLLFNNLKKECKRCSLLINLENVTF